MSGNSHNNLNVSDNDLKQSFGRINNDQIKNELF